MKTLTFITASLVFTGAAVAESPFAGTWKQNRDKTQFDSRAGIIKIEAEGNGIRYSGSGNPVYNGPLDGSERPGLGSMAKDTFTLKKTGERGYEATQSRNGKPTVREVIEVSADGQTMTSSFTSFAPRKDGKQPTTVFTYKRVGGEPKPFPFVGNWKVDRERTKWGEEPVPMIFSESGGVLTMSNPVTDTKTIIDLDKSEVKVVGASNPPTDIMRTVKRIDAKSFEIGTTRAARTTTSRYSVSPDGKLMTIRFTGRGEDGKPLTTTSYYERQ
jgi:hypothetical protein